MISGMEFPGQLVEKHFQLHFYDYRHKQSKDFLQVFIQNKCTILVYIFLNEGGKVSEEFHMTTRENISISI